jgi:hypothetical protein
MPRKEKADWTKDWLGMPEFSQNKIRPYAQIVIRVDNEADLEELGKRLEQKFTPKTKSAWFPFKSHWGAEKKIWISKQTHENE